MVRALCRAVERRALHQLVTDARTPRKPDDLGYTVVVRCSGEYVDAIERAAVFKPFENGVFAEYLYALLPCRSRAERTSFDKLFAFFLALRDAGKNTVALGLNLVAATARLRALGARAAQTAGTAILEKIGRNSRRLLVHHPRDLADLPLRTIAAAQLKKVHKLARVHRNYHLGLASVWQYEPRILVGLFAAAKRALPIAIPVHDRIHLSDVTRDSRRAERFYRRRYNVIERVLRYIALRPYGKRRYTMTRYLREQRARNTLNGERERRVLYWRHVSHFRQFGNKRRVVLSHDVFGKVGQFPVGIAQLSRESDGSLGILRVPYEIDFGCYLHIIIL